jgi:methylthioribose-1-phosphate isomerase
VLETAARGKSKEEIRELALIEANKIFAEDREACDSIGRYGAEELSTYKTLMTHCNAGRLATTGIGTALGVIYGKALAGQEVEVFAAETRPLLQGARLTAWELSNAGIPVTVIPDSSACSLMASGVVDAVVVGADRIATNGDVANKIGTFTHAVSARNAGIPFYVAAPTTTFDPDTSNGQDIKIEQRDPNEVRGVEKVNVPNEGVEIWNPAFDVTPAELITGIITEYGVIRSDYCESIENLLARASL